MSTATTPRLHWDSAGTPPALRELLRGLAVDYPFIERPSAGGAAAPGLVLQAAHDPALAGFVCERQGDCVQLRYGRLSHAGRALGAILAGLLPDGARLAEEPAFDTLGVLLDCGHNATIRPEHLRGWLRRLALLGYTTVMLYTEAGYSLPDEPCFGYMRGGWTAAALRDLDDCAAGLGLELVGSIQALGHLEQVLKWTPYLALRDTEHTLLVGDPGTAALVEKMVAFWAGTLRSRRLHLGMDETYDLGRGRALDRHGHRSGLDLYTEHLGQVADSCRRHGLRPMIWSDVLFRLAGATGGHYDPASRIPEAVRAGLPKDLDLVYWDYYSDSPEHYRERIERHRALGCEPVMASGVWTWPTPWHDWRRTERHGGACIEACRQAGLKEFMVALWSDDGAFWELDSGLAGLAYIAERSWGTGVVDDGVLSRRFRAVCGSDLAVHRLASRLNDRLTACSVLWDDPLCAIYLRHASREGTQPLREAAAEYRRVADGLAPHGHDRAAGDLHHARLVALVMAAKTALAAQLFEAYAAGDRPGLGEVRDAVPDLVAHLEALAQSYRRLWLERCEPFGLEVLQIRFAGQVARYRELAERLGEFLDGRVESIPELDEARKGAWLPARSLSYRALASGARVF